MYAAVWLIFVACCSLICFFSTRKLIIEGFLYLMMPCLSYCRLRKINFFALAASSLIWPYLLLFWLSPLVLLLRYGCIDYVEHWRSYKLWRLRKTFLLLAIQVLSYQMTESDCCDCRSNRIGYYSRCYFSSLFVFDLTLIIWKVIRRDRYNGFHFQSQPHFAQ